MITLVPRLRPLVVAAVAGIASACSAPSVQGGQGAGHEPFTPYGRWQVVSVDGVPARSAFEESPPPSVAFEAGRYGGSGGCNGFGAVGVWVEGRWYGDWPMMTAMACPDVMDQEAKITGILGSAPEITPLTQGQIQVRSEGGTLVLSPMPDEVPQPEPEEGEPPLLAGAGFVLRAADGKPGDYPRETRFRFNADQWTLVSDCGTSGGTWQQDGRSLRLTLTRQDAACHDNGLHRSIRGMADQTTGFATGPNGEFVLGGAGHWVLGDRERTDPRQDLVRMHGTWTAEQVNGADVPSGEAAPRVSFGPGSYSVWDGCNSTEGLALTLRGVLHTAASGLSTLAQCPPNAQGTAVKAVATGQPNVAWDEAGNLVLVTREGQVGLTKTAPMPATAARSLALRAGMQIDLSNNAGRLHLVDGRRFTVTLACARFNGEWRAPTARNPLVRMSPEGVQQTRPGCDVGPGSPAFIANQTLTGDVQSVVDPNGERVLIVGDFGALSGRVVR